MRCRSAVQSSGGEESWRAGVIVNYNFGGGSQEGKTSIDDSRITT